MRRNERKKAQAIQMKTNRRNNFFSITNLAGAAELSHEQEEQK